MMTGKVELDRHDLVFLTREGKRQVLEHAGETFREKYGRELLCRIAGTVPGIVRRQTDGEAGDRDAVKLGFSWWKRLDGQRVRFPSECSSSEMIRVVTPWELPAGWGRMKNSSLENLLRSIRRAGEKQGIKTGFFGSCAMEMVSGLPYTDDGSDLDVIVWAGPWPDRETALRGEEKLEGFYRECVSLAGSVPLDMEIYWKDKGSVKAKEWFSGSGTVLVKGTWGACLESRSRLMEIE